jgi:hypothetical protein
LLREIHGEISIPRTTSSGAARIALQSGCGQSYNVSMTTSTDNLVTLAELSTDMEAAMIIAALEREGIEAFMKGEFTASFRAEAPSWPKVEVRESDYERARAILDEMNPAVVSEPVDESDIAVDSTFRKFCLIVLGIGIAGYVGISLLMWIAQ